MAWEKYREEQDVWAVDWTAELADGETIADAEVSVIVLDRAGVDVTADFLASTTVELPYLRIGLSAAADAAQPEGDYSVRVLATTSNGRVLEERVWLSVKA